MLGAVASQWSSNWINNGSYTHSSTVNSYVWYDGALQSSISHTTSAYGQPTTVYTTTFAYNALGQLTSAQVSDGKPHTVSFTNDELGQIIRRDESGVAGQTGAPHEMWYRFMGRQLGYTGNNPVLSACLGRQSKGVAPTWRWPIRSPIGRWWHKASNLPPHARTN